MINPARPPHINKKTDFKAVLAVVFSILLSLELYATVINSVSAATDHGGEDWIISSDTTISGEHTNINNFVVNTGVTLTVDAFDGIDFGGKLIVEANNAQIDGIIDATGKGYAENNGPTPGQSSISRCAGGHGGNGGSYSDTTTCGGRISGDLYNPQELGSGGSKGYSSGGRGGGRISLSVADSTIINGSIFSNGDKGANRYSSYAGSGGGAGGSIHITTNSLSGSGSIVAKGGNGGTSSDDTLDGAGGGGGRIAIYYNSSSFNGSYDTSGGLGSNSTSTQYAQNGSAGTIYIKDNSSDYDKLIISNPAIDHYDSNLTTLFNGEYSFNEIVLTQKGGLEITDGVDITVTDSFNPTGDFYLKHRSAGSLSGLVPLDLTTTGNVIIEDSNNNLSFNNLIIDSGITSLKGNLTFENISINNTATLTHLPNTNQKVNYINLTVNQDFYLASTAKVDLNGKGYTGETGPTPGLYPGSGGGHGGKGGSKSTGSGGSISGDLYNPQELGSGGSDGDGGYIGGIGGGAISLSVSGTTSINGILSSDGSAAQTSKGTYASGGGGAGGSIHITTNSLSGSGSIVAKGGNGGRLSGTNYAGAGGGGGRIAIYYNSSSFNGSYDTSGGLGSSSTDTQYAQNGSAGTIYIKDNSSDYDKLIISNPAIDHYDSNLTTLFNGEYSFNEIVLTQKGGLEITDGVDITVTDSFNPTGDFYLKHRSAGSLSYPTPFDLTTTGNVIIEDSNNNLSFNNLTVNSGTTTLEGTFTLQDLTVHAGDMFLRGEITANNAILNNDFTIETNNSSFKGFTVNSGTTTLNGNLTVEDVTINNTATLTHLPNTNQQTNYLILNAHNITISENASLDVSAKGYAATFGQGAGSSGSLGGGGGGHGGNGGASSGGTAGGQSYGNYTDPQYIGSGGGNDSSTGSPGGSGGGYVRLNISNKLDIVGSIRANGGNGLSTTSSYGPGGGAGGSIYIDAGEITGIGLIQANGGNGADQNDDGGGGGGGRIALYYLQNNFTGTVEARGGFGPGNAIDGQNGTYYNHQFVYEITLSSPTGNIEMTGTTPLLDWEASQDPLIHTYEVYIDEVMVATVFAPITEYQIINALSESIHTWRIVGRRADNSYSGESVVETFTIDYLNNINLNSPIPNYISTTSIITFDWSNSVDPWISTYELYIDEVLIKILNHPTTIYAIETPLAEGAHTWQVLGKQTDNSLSGESPVYSFTIDLPDPITLISPVGGVRLENNNRPLLEWQPSADPDIGSYRVYLDNSLRETVQHPTTQYQVSFNLAEENHTWRIVARKTNNQSSGESITENFSVDMLNTTINTVAPKLGINDSTPLIRWTRPSDIHINSYEIYLDENLIGTVGSGISQFQVIDELEEGNHTWKVVAKRSDGVITGESAATEFNIKILYPITLLSPIDYTTIDNARPSLNWEASQDPDIKEYEVYVNNSLIDTVPHPTTEYTLMNALNDGTHSWKIIAREISDEYSGESALERFILQIPPDTYPISLISPTNNQTLNTATPTLSWSASPDPAINEYEIYIDSIPIATVAADVTEYTLADSLGEGSHSWKVIGYKINGENSGEGPQRSFFVLLPSTVYPIELISPSGGVQINTPKPTLTWTQSADPYIKRYELYLDTVKIENLSKTTQSYSLRNALSIGDHTWMIKVIRTNDTVSAEVETNFTVVVPEDLYPFALTYPINNRVIPTDKPLLDWEISLDPFIKSYRIYIDDEYLVTANHPTTHYQLTQPLTEGNHTWKVEAYRQNNALSFESSSDFIVVLPPVSPTGINLMTPVDDEVIGSDTFLFRWNHPTIPSLAGYHLYIDNILFEELGPESNQYELAKELNSGYHTWEIIALNDTSEIVGVSAQARFIMFSPQILNITSPQPGFDFSTNKRPLISWSKSSERRTDYYEVLLNNKVIAIIVAPLTSYQMTADLTDDNYSLQIVAKSIEGIVLGVSDTFTFELLTNGDETEPTAPPEEEDTEDVTEDTKTDEQGPKEDVPDIPGEGEDLLPELPETDESNNEEEPDETPTPGEVIKEIGKEVGKVAESLKSDLQSFVLLAFSVGTSLISLLFYPSLVPYLLGWLRGEHKRKDWGLVYDRQTMQPIAFASIKVYDKSEKLVQQTLSNMNGKYGFVIGKGSYILETHHSDYQIASMRIDIQEESSLTVDIALNEKGAKHISYLRKIKLNWKNVLTMFFYIGFIFSLTLFVINPNSLRFTIVLLYTLQILLLKISSQPRNWGYIYNSLNHKRIPGAFVRLFERESGRQVNVQISDAQGRFGFNNTKGNFELSIDKPGYSFPAREENPTDMSTTATGQKRLKVYTQRGKIIYYDIPLDPSGKTRQTGPFGL